MCVTIKGAIIEYDNNPPRISDCIIYDKNPQHILRNVTKNITCFPKTKNGDNTRHAFVKCFKYTHTNVIRIPEISNDKTDPTKNLHNNGAMPPLGTHPSSPHSHIEDAWVALSKTPPRTGIKAGDAVLQACVGDLPDVHLLGAEYMLFEVYVDCVHQNLRLLLYGGITDDGKWKAR